MMYRLIFLTIILSATKASQPIFGQEWISALSHQNHHFRRFTGESLLLAEPHNPFFRSIHRQQFIVDSETGEHFEVKFRLPNNTVPETYEISLWTLIDQSDFQFTGNVTIGVRAVTNTTFITLHQKELSIKSVTLIDPKNGHRIVVNRNELDYSEINEFLTISFTDYVLVKDNRYFLTILYNGTLRSDDAGFYRSSYVAENGTVRWLATTQFESTDARHAFPCYDEPQLKANFKIRITHRDGLTAISNMPVTSIRKK